MKPKIELYEAEIEFKVKGKKVNFKIIHNIPNQINNAFESWVYRTKNYTDLDFCEYIKSKDLSFVAITEKEFKGFNNE